MRKHRGESTRNREVSRKQSHQARPGRALSGRWGARRRACSIYSGESNGSAVRLSEARCRCGACRRMLAA